MDTVRKYLLRPIEVVIAMMLAVMLVLVLLNVVLRYALNSGITVTEELSRLLFVWLVFLGAAISASTPCFTSCRVRPKSSASCCRTRSCFISAG